MPDVHWERHGIGKMRDYREKKDLAGKVFHRVFSCYIDAYRLHKQAGQYRR